MCAVPPPEPGLNEQGERGVSAQALADVPGKEEGNLPSSGSHPNEMPFFFKPFSPHPIEPDEEDDEVEEEVEAAAEDEAVDEACQDEPDAAEPFATYWTATVASASDADEAGEDAWREDEPEAEMLAAIFA